MTRVVAIEPRNAVHRPPSMRLEDLPNCIGAEVTVNGWLSGQRATRNFRFLGLRGRNCEVQAVCRNPALFEFIEGLAPETAIRITGSVRAAKTDRFGPVEIDATHIMVAGAVSARRQERQDDKKRPSTRALELRLPEQALIFAVKTTLLSAAREFLLLRDFLEIQTPKITSSGSESGAELFKLDYFGGEAYLAQSPQFYMQMAMAAGFEYVFETGPIFRADPSTTNRHAAEFTCLDVELSWVESHHEVMDFEEALLRSMIEAVACRHGPDIERRFGVKVEMLDAPIPRISYDEALRIAGDKADGRSDRLTGRAERALTKHVKALTGSSFVFVTDYPAETRPFYTMREQPRSVGPALSRSFDLLWRGLEITSGCQREHVAAQVRRQAIDSGMPPDLIQSYLVPHYLVLFEHGCPPHGGFGIGLERLVMALLGLPSIEDASFVFRGLGRLTP